VVDCARDPSWVRVRPPSEVPVPSLPSRSRLARLAAPVALLVASPVVLAGPAHAASSASSAPSGPDGGRVESTVSYAYDDAGDLEVEDTGSVPERVVRYSDLSKVAYKTQLRARYVQVTYRPEEVHTVRRVKQLFATTYRRPGTGALFTLTASVVARPGAPTDRPFFAVSRIDGASGTCPGARVRVVRTQAGPDKVVHRVPFSCLGFEPRGTVEVGSYSLVEGRTDAGDLGIDRVARTRILPVGQAGRQATPA